MQVWNNAARYISVVFFAPEKWNDKNYFIMHKDDLNLY